MCVLLSLAQAARGVRGAAKPVSKIKKGLETLKWGHESHWRRVRLCSCLSKRTSRCMCERDKEASAAGAWSCEEDWKFWSLVVRKSWVYCRGCLSRNSYSCCCSLIVCFFCVCFSFWICFQYLKWSRWIEIWCGDHVLMWTEVESYQHLFQSK